MHTGTLKNFYHQRFSGFPEPNHNLSTSEVLEAQSCSGNLLTPTKTSTDIFAQQRLQYIFLPKGGHSGFKSGGLHFAQVRNSLTTSVGHAFLYVITTPAEQAKKESGFSCFVLHQVFAKVNIGVNRM